MERMPNTKLTLSKIQKNFDFVIDTELSDYYSGSWNIKNHEEFELYINAPKKRINLSQIDNFNAFLDNHLAIRNQIEAKMTSILKQRKGRRWEKVIARPLNFSIISVLCDGKDYEGNPCNYDMEILSTKFYKVFFQKIPVDIVAFIKQGEIIEIGDEIL